MAASTPETDHFEGKEAIEHVAEKHARGLITSTESHGVESPGHLAAALDAARETGVLMLMLWTLLTNFGSGQLPVIGILSVIGFGWLLWKLGRASWLGWARLERLHRIMAEERWEIENHRDQEREELRVLYSAKGFEGKLLEEVVAVLMADGDRLLRVMIEEEMGFSLEVHEHPLKQGFGAAVGVLSATILSLLGVWVFPSVGLIIGAAIAIGIAAGISARLEGNRIVPAVVWNLGIATLALGAAHFLLQLLPGGV